MGGGRPLWSAPETGPAEFLFFLFWNVLIPASHFVDVIYVLYLWVGRGWGGGGGRFEL